MDLVAFVLTVWTFLVALLAVALTVRQIARSDRWRREDAQRRELEQIIEFHRTKVPSDLSADVALGAAPVPREWIDEWREKIRGHRKDE